MSAFATMVLVEAPIGPAETAFLSISMIEIVHMGHTWRRTRHILVDGAFCSWFATCRSAWPNYGVIDSESTVASLLRMYINSLEISCAPPAMICSECLIVLREVRTTMHQLIWIPIWFDWSIMSSFWLYWFVLMQVSKIVWVREKVEAILFGLAQNRAPVIKGAPLHVHAHWSLRPLMHRSCLDFMFWPLDRFILFLLIGVIGHHRLQNRFVGIVLQAPRSSLFVRLTHRISSHR